MKTFTYMSNNSGGNWWLSDSDWVALEREGWKVYWGGWNDGNTDSMYKSAEEVGDNRWLDCLAKEASKEFNNIEEAIADWERITNENYEDEGCECCGRPHEIY